MNITDALNWRFATKRMSGEKVPKDKLERVLEAARLAPSSYGLQPYSVIVIEDQKLKEKISSIGFDQPQITQSSHLLVFAAHDNISEDNIDDFIQLTAETQGTNVSELDSYKAMIKGAVNRFSSEEKLHWASKQAYISLGTAVTAAAFEQIDASPMEGFDKDALDQLLGFKERGLNSLVMLALGFRHENDHHAGMKKVRRSSTEMFIHM